MTKGKRMTPDDALAFFLVLSNASNIDSLELFSVTGERIALTQMSSWPLRWGLAFRATTLALTGGVLPPVLPWGDFGAATRVTTHHDVWPSSRLIALLWRFGIAFHEPSPDVLFGAAAVVLADPAWDVAPSVDDFPAAPEAADEESSEDFERRLACRAVAECLAPARAELKDATLYADRGPVEAFTFPAHADLIDMRPGVNAACRVGLTGGIVVVLGARDVQVSSDGREEGVEKGHSLDLRPGFHVFWAVHHTVSDPPTRLVVRPASQRGALTFYEGEPLVKNLRIAQSPIAVTGGSRRIYEVLGTLEFTWEGDSIEVWVLNRNRVRFQQLHPGGKDVNNSEHALEVQVTGTGAETELHFS
jgi:hypothetical protein